jgi:NADH-quinone oxidoreductase subunit L
LLFLCSGVFIHAYETNNIFEISRQKGHNLKIPTICIIIAAAALAGIPPLSGFFSKELILAALANLNNPIWLLAGLLGAFLTAYYAFRLIFILLFPKHSTQESPATLITGHDADHHLRLYWVMAWPLIILAILTVLLGFFETSLNDFVGDQLRTRTNNYHPWLPYVALVIAAAGVGLAWMEFGRRGANQIGFVERIPFLKTLFTERWFIDHFYRLLLNRIIYRGFSYICTKNDNQVIDGSIDGFSKGAVETGRILSLLHLGMVQYRLLVIFIVMILLSLYFFF